MPAFRFCDLPPIVHEKIFEYFTFADLFYLTFTSTKVKNYVAYFNFKFDDYIYIEVTQYRHVKLQIKNLLLEWKWETLTENNKMITINVNGVEVTGRKFDYVDDKQGFVMHPINIDVSLFTNYLMQLFRNEKYFFQTEFVMPEMLESLNLPPRTQVFYLKWMDPIPATVVDGMLNIIKPEELRSSPKFIGFPEENSVIWSIPELLLFNAQWIDFEHLKKFNTTFLWLTRSVLTTNNVVTYLKLWKQGEYSILETLEINLQVDANLSFDIDEIRRELEAVPSDPNENLGYKCFYDESLETWEFRRNNGERAVMYITNAGREPTLRVQFRE